MQSSLQFTCLCPVLEWHLERCLADPNPKRSMPPIMTKMLATKALGKVAEWLRRCF